MAADVSARSKEAIRTFRELIDERPTFANAYASLAHVLQETGRHREAIAVIEHALEQGIQTRTMMGGGSASIIRKPAIWKIRRGIVYAQSGRESQTIGAWKRAVELDASEYDTIYNLGTLLTQLNRFQEALPFLELFVRTAPHDPYARDVAGIERLIAQLRAAGH